MKRWIVTGLTYAAAALIAGFLLSLNRTPALSEARPDPYEIGGAAPYGSHSARVTPWTDPDTGCQYLITQTSHGDISTVMRSDRFGRHACPGPKQN